jgi:hypothetical protein
MTEPIKQPRNKVVRSGPHKAELAWDPRFAPKWTRRYSKAQTFVDGAVLHYSEPFIPLLTGTLIRTGILGTDVGSGKVQWIAPYARQQDYRGRSPGVSQTGPLRGRFWFERMKALFGEKIIRAAKQLVGRG